MSEESANWVVVVRALKGSDRVCYYALRSLELVPLAVDPELVNWSVEAVLDEREWKACYTVRGGRLLDSLVGHSNPASTRIVQFDAVNRITAIGERVFSGSSNGSVGGLLGGSGANVGGTLYGLLGGGQVNVGGPLGGFLGSLGGAFSKSDYTSSLVDLGPMRGGARLPSTGVEVMLSAETEAEIDVGATMLVAFQVELASEAVPLAVAQQAIATADELIAVSLSVDSDAVQIVREQSRTVDPPAPGQVRTGFFRVKAFRPGVVRLAVAFRQGGTELGVIGLVVEVVQAGARSERAQSSVAAAPRDTADDDKLLLTVKRVQKGEEIYYEYFLTSERLGLVHGPRSKSLLDRGGGPAATELAFIERIYDRVTKELKSRDDLRQLQREARALGANLCQELFDPEVAKVLWPLRGRINAIQVVSWEPYIPWELVRLRDPTSGEIDERFLAEYGLVRTLSDEVPARSLPMARWAYLGATYPMGSFPPVGAELDYFTATTHESLRGRGIVAEPIAATRDGLYDALAKGDFDVLHISCHAEALHESIERASLIISDETSLGDVQARPVEVDMVTVQAEARLRLRRPLVFLNGCETGRIGAVLTAWGGWPNVFLRAGAGAFVGSAWAVRDKPAAAFSTAFYNALLDGKPLFEAANAARAAARMLGDASWLAFKVYGHPRAHRADL